MVVDMYNEVISLEEDVKMATNPYELDSILARSMEVMPAIGNPKLQVKSLQVMQAAISKYIKLRTS